MFQAASLSLSSLPDGSIVFCCPAAGLLENRLGTVSASKVQASITTLIVAGLGFLALKAKSMLKVFKAKAPPTPLKGDASDAIVLYGGYQGFLIAFAFTANILAA